MRSGCKPPPNNRSTTTAKRNNIKNYKQKEKRTFAPEYVTQISDDKPCKSLSSKTDRPTNRPPRHPVTPNGYTRQDTLRTSRNRLRFPLLKKYGLLPSPTGRNSRSTEKARKSMPNTAHEIYPLMAKNAGVYNICIIKF